MNATDTYILSIDQSTSATKVMLFDRQARLIHRVTVKHAQHYPEPGFVEHDPQEIFDNMIHGIGQLMAEHPAGAGRIACMAITNKLKKNF